MRQLNLIEGIMNWLDTRLRRVLCFFRGHVEINRGHTFEQCMYCLKVKRK